MFVTSIVKILPEELPMHDTKENFFKFFFEARYKGDIKTISRNTSVIISLIKKKRWCEELKK